MVKFVMTYVVTLALLELLVMLVPSARLVPPVLLVNLALWALLVPVVIAAIVAAGARRATPEKRARMLRMLR
jgi:hypothetical protein